MKDADHFKGFGARLRRAMDLVGIRKNVDLAARVGCSEGTIRYLLSQIDTPKKLETPTKIAKTLHVRVAWLLHGVGEMHTDPSEDVSLDTDYAHGGALGKAPSLVKEANPLDAALLAKALAAALRHRPNQSPETLAEAAVDGYEAALRQGKPGRIEELVKAFMD